MSAEIITLGLAVDSSGVVRASRDLDALAAKAIGTAKAVTNLESALAAATADMNIAQQRTKNFTVDMSALERAVQSTLGDLNVHAAATRNAATAQKSMSFEARNLSYQLVDVSQGLLMGQSAFQIFAQQGGQVAQVIATSPGGLGGLFKELRSSIASIITPTTMLVAGVAATGGAAYLAYSSWKSFALGLDDTARQANTTSSEMAKLQAVASFKGIDSESFQKGIGGFSRSIYEARNNMGGLVEVLRANGVSAAGSFTTVFGKAANLIKNASTDQQRLVLLQQMGLPATMEWVRFMSQGADGIKRATDDAQEFGGAANDHMVKKAREFDDAWNKTWTNWGLKWRGAVVDASDGLDSLIQKGRSGLMKLGVDVPGNLIRSGIGDKVTANTDFSDFYKSTGADKALKPYGPDAPTKDPQAVQKAIALEQQRIGILGQSASVQMQVRSIELQVQQARLAGVNVSNAELNTLRELARQQALGTFAIRASADAARVEAETIGMGAGQAAAYTAAQNALNEARRNGRVLTAEQVAEIQREAEALGNAVERADQMRNGYEMLSGTMRNLGQEIRQNGLSLQTLGNVGVNALGRIADKLMDMASQGLWKAAFGGGGGGFLSLLGIGSNATDGIGGFGPTAPAGVNHTGYGPGDTMTNFRALPAEIVPHLPRHHTGIGPGERAAVLENTEGVFTKGQMKALAPVGSGKSVQITNHYQFIGVEPGMEARMRAYIDQGDKRSVEQAVTHVGRLKNNSPGYIG